MAVCVARKVQQESLQAAERPKVAAQRAPPVGELVSSIDWSSTSFGSPEEWSAGFRGTLDACLNERWPIALFLGPDSAQLYNDAYGRLIADRHPAALGCRPADIYPDIWPRIEPLLRSVVETGKEAQSGDLALDIRRDGKREERHVSFSFSALGSFGRGAAAVLGIATDATERVVGARRLGVVADLAGRFLATTTVTEACRIGVDLLGANAADVAFAAIYVLEGQEHAARLVAASGIDAPDAGLWPLAEAARQGAPLGVEGLTRSAHRLNLPANRTPDQAVLVPLTPRGVAGPPAVLVVGVNPCRPYDDGYRDFARLAGSQIGAAINQARAREEERRATKREAALQAEATLAARRLATVLGSISDTFESFDREWRYTSVSRRSIELMSLGVDDVIGRRLWDLFPDLVETPFYDAARRAVEENIVTRVEYAYPVGSDRWLEARFHPSADGVTLVTTQISERKRAEDALRTRARQQEAVAQLGREALLGNDLGILMDLATAVVSDTLGDARSMILEFLPDRGQLRLRAGVGWQPGSVGHALADGDASSLFGHALTSASPLIVEDLATRTGLRIPPLLTEHAVVSGVSVVIGAVDGGAWGLLGVQTTARRRFTAEDVNFLQAVAHVLAAAIHRETVTEALASERTTLEDRVARRTRALASANQLLKRLSARLMETQEGERRRIARELHDQTGQALTALKMNLEAIRTSSEDHPTNLKVVERVDIVDGLLEQIRNLALDLHPAVLDDFGLPAALRCYARRLAQRGGLQLDLGVADLAERLPPAIETTCFRVAQEALTNVVRHARARRVAVELRSDGVTARLLVRDDGVGFDAAAGPADGPADRHLGLLSMRERVALAGGDIVIASKTGTGTEIAVSFPLQRGE
jgi:signal transduction histidine kinase/PAS domain-containing protein